MCIADAKRFQWQDACRKTSGLPALFSDRMMGNPTADRPHANCSMLQVFEASVSIAYGHGRSELARVCACSLAERFWEPLPMVVQAVDSLSPDQHQLKNRCLATSTAIEAFSAGAADVSTNA